MTVWRWPRVTMTVHSDFIVHLFKDGKENVFDLTWADNCLEYREIARWAGYGEDHRLYAVQHDITHHCLAYHLGWTHSPAIHDPQLDFVFGAKMPPVIEWEEHVVGRLQRYARCAEPDEFGVIQRLFRELDGSAAELRRIWESPFS